MNNASAVGATGATTRGDEVRLRKAARQLYGVFVEQPFKAMRETVPHDGLTDGGAGEDMFSGMLDQRLSENATARWKHGVSDGIVRQLLPHLRATATNPGADAPGAAPTSDLKRTR